MFNITKFDIRISKNESCILNENHGSNSTHPVQFIIETTSVANGFTSFCTSPKCGLGSFTI